MRVIFPHPYIPLAVAAAAAYLAQVLCTGAEVLDVPLVYLARNLDQLVPPAVLGQDGNGTVILLGLRSKKEISQSGEEKKMSEEKGQK
jgi:hypothetical protein